MNAYTQTSPTVESDYDRARHALADLRTPSGLVLGDVIARLVLDSGVVTPVHDHAGVTS